MHIQEAAGVRLPCPNDDVSGILFSVSSRTIAKDLAGRGSYSVPPHLATAARSKYSVSTCHPRLTVEHWKLLSLPSSLSPDILVIQRRECNAVLFVIRYLINRIRGGV
jgi:hypothetical protein